MLLLALACAHPAAPAKLALEPPRLPAPVGEVYGHHVAPPPDPVVARVMDGAPCDEVLSGAAAGLALDLGNDGPIDAYAIRWRAVRAGYPYAVVAAAHARVAAGGVPETLVADARTRAAGGAEVGLARARDGEEDVWVMLVGAPGAPVDRVPREHAVGDRVTLGAGWRVADPTGEVRAVSGPLTLDVAGEWLVQDPNGSATFPLYVGRKTPETPPVVADSSGATVEDRARAVLSRVWSWYGREAPDFDSALDSVARARLRALQAGEGLPPVDEQLRKAGFVDVPVAGAECRAADPVACLDGIWWSLERRAVLAGDHDAVGVASGAVGGETVLVVLAAG